MRGRKAKLLCCNNHTQSLSSCKLVRARMQGSQHSTVAERALQATVSIKQHEIEQMRKIPYRQAGGSLLYLAQHATGWPRRSVLAESEPEHA